MESGVCGVGGTGSGEDFKGKMKQDSASESSLPVTLRALKHRNFQLFFSGQLISLIGTWMQSVAQAWLVYRLTGSSLLLGRWDLPSQIPVFLIAPIGGIVADRYNRQHVVIGTQIASMILAGILAALTLTGQVQVWHIFVLAALLGVVNAFDIPGAAVVSGRHGGQGRPDERDCAELVHVQRRANHRSGDRGNSGGENRRRLVLFCQCRQLHRGDCRPAADAGAEARLPGCRTASPLEHIIEGFRFVRDTAPIRVILLLLGLVSFVGDAVHRADAGVRGQGSAWRRSRPGHPDGRDRRRRFARSTDAGDARGRAQAWDAGWRFPAEAFGLSLILFSLSRNFGCRRRCCCRWDFS